MQAFEYGIGIGFPVLFLVLFSPPVIERLGPNGFIGIRIRSVMRSKAAWNAGHRAAWPIIRNLCLASLVISVGCLIGTIMTGEEAYGWVALFASMALVGVGSLFAVVPASAAAEAAPRVAAE